MSTPTGAEAGGFLPMTGTGPFTFVLAAIGLVMAAGGGLARLVARR